MKVIAVLGSPNEHGFSSTLAKEVLRGAGDAGHNVVIYEVNKMNLKGCQGCRYCKNNGVDCIIHDDLDPYWKDLHECGALLVSSPNYCSQISGPMITYMNRHFCLIDKKEKPRIHPGIKLIGVFSQGSENKDLYKAQYNWFLGDFQNRDMVLTETLIHLNYQQLTPDCELMLRAYKTGYTL